MFSISPALRTKAALAFAVAVWFYYCVVHVLLGPLQPDQLYFAHIFWMLRHGLHQYSDFYSYHLPVYFQILLPFLPSGEGLTFVWWLRATVLVPVAVYFLITNWRQWPFVLIFVIYGRMAEIRPDTFGLLLFNLGWWILLRRGSLTLAAFFAGLSLLFSARAAVMVVPFGLLCLYLAKDNRKALVSLVGLGAAFVVTGAVIYAAAPDTILKIVSAVYLDTARTFHMGLIPRFAGADRMILIALMSAALIGAWRQRALVIIVAVLSQFALILLDPNPYGYVYGWSMVPVVAGLALLPAVGTSAMAFLSALAILVLGVGYAAWRGDPGPGRSLHLVMERPLPSVRGWDTPRLINAMIKRHEIWNEIAIRNEVCRRFRTVTARFWYQPGCARDAYYEWIGLNWTPEQVKRWPKADLVVWGDLTYPKDGLAGYEVHKGFAIKRLQP